MNKKLMTLIAILGTLSLFADAKYLYWMVDENDDDEPYDFTYATVKANGTELGYYSQESSEPDGTRFYISEYATADDGWETNPGYAGDLDGYGTSTKFTFELWLEDEQGNGDLVAWKSMNYSSVASHLFSNTQAGSGATPLVVSGFVPEPTSGLLIMLGLATLALKRSRA